MTSLSSAVDGVADGQVVGQHLLQHRHLVLRCVGPLATDAPSVVGGRVRRRRAVASPCCPTWPCRRRGRAVGRGGGVHRGDGRRHRGGDALGPLDVAQQRVGVLGDERHLARLDGRVVGLARADRVLAGDADARVLHRLRVDLREELALGEVADDTVTVSGPELTDPLEDVPSDEPPSPSSSLPHAPRASAADDRQTPSIRGSSSPCLPSRPGGRGTHAAPGTGCPGRRRSQT